MQELFLLCAFIFKVLRSFSKRLATAVAVMLFPVVLAFRFSVHRDGSWGRCLVSRGVGLGCGLWAGGLGGWWRLRWVGVNSGG